MNDLSAVTAVAASDESREALPMGGTAPVPPVEDLGVLRRRHPIDVFDRRVEFCEYAAVRDGCRALDVVVDEETGTHQGELPPGVEIRGHVYFLDGRLVTTPSMTGFLKNFFPNDFDADLHATRISSGTRIMSDQRYKYYQYARDTVETVWLGADLPYEQLERGYNTDPQSAAADEGPYAEFRYVHDSVVRAKLIKDWEDNGKLQSGLGKEMHRSIELFYNEYPAIDTADRFKTTEFGYFRNFHRDWVQPRDLVMYRTELSLCYYAIRLCGMIDAMFVYASDLASGKPLRRCVLVDWKRANDLQFTSFNGRDMAREPFGHLQLCDGSKYYAQLNGYKCILERYTDFRVDSCHIAVFHPTESNFRVHDVPDLQTQFKSCVARAALAQANKTTGKTDSCAPAAAVPAAAVPTKKRAAQAARPVQKVGSRRK
jgi:hypothetical protein